MVHFTAIEIHSKIKIYEQIKNHVQINMFLENVNPPY